MRFLLTHPLLLLFPSSRCAWWLLIFSLECFTVISTPFFLSSTTLEWIIVSWLFKFFLQFLAVFVPGNVVLIRTSSNGRCWLYCFCWTQSLFLSLMDLTTFLAVNEKNFYFVKWTVKFFDQFYLRMILIKQVQRNSDGNPCGPGWLNRACKSQANFQILYQSGWGSVWARSDIHRKSPLSKALWFGPLFILAHTMTGSPINSFHGRWNNRKIARASRIRSKKHCMHTLRRAMPYYCDYDY